MIAKRALYFVYLYSACFQSISFSLWHAFDRGLLSGLNHSFCAQYVLESSLSEIQRQIKFWPVASNEIAYLRVANRLNSILYWEYAINLVWRHQHPSNCSSVKFVVVPPWNGGMPYKKNFKHLNICLLLFLKPLS